MATEFVGGKLELVLMPSDLQDWESSLDSLSAGRNIRWLDDGRSPEIDVSAPDSDGSVKVTVIDRPSSGASVTLELPVPDGWIDDHRDRLRSVREAWPSEVLEPSPGVYEWRAGSPPAH
ncbi:DUF5959 family protein [Amycolatopsis cynarae]|uniref:DUF5959 family protein n=1 Tax=Amycolatopsis cynarae TaxID=2995223 RepID=A0ABY7B5A3_9PSEU|nr:DUF5959 family protein [Amycolatopsis sp. HUAS 11-8]WAL65978.1 DUF5959 family protein [Amycolatopsis sp. HUAS 11-8]